MYTLFLILKATPVLENHDLAGAAQWIAYLALVASGFFCLVGVAKFAGVLRQVTRPIAGETAFLPVPGRGKS